jgi:hypothetical protein
MIWPRSVLFHKLQSFIQNIYPEPYSKVPVQELERIEFQVEMSICKTLMNSITLTRNNFQIVWQD